LIPNPDRPTPVPLFGGAGFFFLRGTWDNEPDGNEFMRKPRWSSAAAWTALVLLSSCVRLVPRTAPEPPAVVLDRHLLCATVERTKDWVEAAADRNIFLLGRDEAVYSVLFFVEIRGAHTVVWKWYDPSGQLVIASDPVAVGAADRVFDRYVAWDRKPLAAENKPGFWTVAVFIDERLAGTREFEVKGRS
jgi:hypothetical protein